MSTAQAVSFLELILGLVALWATFYYWGRDYILDSFRQHVFNLRGELFDYALRDGLPFSDPAYTRLRSRMNHLIRYAHRLNAVFWLGAIVSYKCRKVEYELPLDRWREAVDEVPLEQHRRALLNFNDRLCQLLAKRVLLGSGVLLLIVPTVVIAMATARAIGAFIRQPEHAWSRLRARSFHALRFAMILSFVCLRVSHMRTFPLLEADQLIEHRRPLTASSN